MKARLLHTLPLFVVLVVTWWLLQGAVTTANVVGGVALAIPLVLFFPVSERVVHHRLHPWAFVKFLVFVLYSLVMSSWEVIKVIVHPTPTSLRSGIVRVRLHKESPLTCTIVANAVTLTPGTMTLTARVDPAEVHIHVMGLDDPEEFRESVYDLERRTTAALTPQFVEREQGGPEPGDGRTTDEDDEGDGW
jgi:multisubunit Na+/H+ antiporter MnhE subunit